MRPVALLVLAVGLAGGALAQPSFIPGVRLCEGGTIQAPVPDPASTRLRPALISFRASPAAGRCDAAPMTALSGDPAAFLPFPPGRFEPYRSRTRLFRTMNDVFLAINQRPQYYLDQSPFGVLDLSGRATGGAFHPTAEGHAIIANETTEELCQRLGCGQ